MCRLAKAIDASLYLLGDLKNFNGEKWTVRYPHIRSADGQEPSCESLLIFPSKRY